MFGIIMEDALIQLDDSMAFRVLGHPVTAY